MTTIKSRLSSNFDQIQQRTAELATLECLEKISIDFQREICCSFFILAGNEDNNKVPGDFEFRPDLTEN